MKILIVCNNAYMKGSGLCVAINKLREQLELRGVDVRLMANANPDPDGPQPDYSLKHYRVPVFEKLINANGFIFATADKELMTEAIEWADVVHLEEPFPMEIKAADIAVSLGKPCVGSFHLFSENVMANLEMMNARIPNYILMEWWRKGVFDKCKIIHCPSESVRKQLVACGFHSELRVISNGLSTEDASASVVPATEPINILCTGRLSNEKSQVTLFKAMEYSRHSREIKLIFAGKGPKEKLYRKLAARLLRKGVLKYAPEFGFHDQEDLAKVESKAYLYIHCACVEVEGLSCLEAISKGAVPVIGEGRLVATSQFALDERSIYPTGDAKALARKIDWWIENPEERQRMSSLYAESVRKYDISLSTDAIIKMYEDAMGK